MQTQILCVTALCGLAQAALAARWDAAVSVGSDFVVRGETRTMGDPVVQAHLGVSNESGWSMGAMLSNVEFHQGPGPSRELDVVLGRTWQPSADWTFRGSLARYTFTDSRPEISYDYTELTAAAAFRELIEITVAYTPDYSDFSLRGIGHERPAMAYDAQVRLPLSASLQLYAGAGYFNLDRLFDAGYSYWSAGADLTLARMTLALQYVGADHTARRLFGKDAVDHRLVATLAVPLH